jgi:poly(3-hydroxybutyrate) depolymerase
MWAEVNGCEGSPTASVEGLVTTTDWSGCTEGTAIRLVRVEGGGHVWFAPGLGEANSAIDATDLITEFFSLVSR